MERSTWLSAAKNASPHQADALQTHGLTLPDGKYPLVQTHNADDSPLPLKIPNYPHSQKVYVINGLRFLCYNMDKENLEATNEKREN